MAFIEQLLRRGRGIKHLRDDTNLNLYQAIITLHDQHYYDGKDWQDVDESLVDDGADGFNKRCDKVRHIFRVTAGGNYRWYPRRLVMTEYVEITGIQYWRPQGGGQWRQLNLPATVWKNTSAEWDMSNLYVSITNNWHRIKTDFVLKDSTAYTRLRFAVNIVGLELDTQTWHLTSMTDQIEVGSIDPPTAIDANDVEIPVTSIYDGAYIEWSVDPTGAVYPIAIDPTFTDGYGGDVFTAYDTCVNNANSTTQARNYGTWAGMYLGNGPQKCLILFDLSSIPDTAICNSAMLYLYHYATGTALAFDATIYVIASGNAGWPEGTKSGAEGGAGDCCWNYYDQDPGFETNWAGSAGLSTSGTDYESTSIGSFSGDRSDAIGTEYSASLTTSRIEGFFGSSNTNYGILIESTGQCPSVGSSEHTTTSYRPKLVVVYTLSGAQDIFPTGISSNESFGTPTISPQSVTLYPSSIASAEVFGSTIVSLAPAPQFARPDSDVGTGGWTDQNGGTTDLWSVIDESTPNDSDYVMDVIDGTPDTLEVGLENLSDPGVHTSHFVRYRYCKDSATKTAQLKVYLMQGVTEIASWTHSDVSESWANAQQELTTEQAGNITDYTNLRLRFEAVEV